MPFDLESAIAVREREDGLLEKDTFDLPSATPIPDGIDPSIMQQTLSNPGVQKLLDTFTGGVTQEESDQFVQEIMEPLANIAPIMTEGGIMPTPMKVGKGTVELAKFVLSAMGRPVAAAQAGIGAVVDKKPLADVVQSMVRGYVKPGEVKSLVSRVPFQEWEQGAWAKLIPRATAEAVETYLVSSLVYGNIPGKIKAAYDESKVAGAAQELNNITTKAAKEIVANPEKFKINFPKEWNEADKLGMTKAYLQNRLGSIPKVGDMLMKRQSFMSKLKATLGSEVGTARIPKIGDAVDWKGQIAKITQIDGERVILALGKSEIVATLSQLSLAPAPKEAVLPAPGVPGEAIAPKTTLSAQEAQEYLKESRIKLKSSSGEIGQATNQTGLEGIRKETLDVAKIFSEKNNMDVTITGGTEEGHAVGEISHGTGHKLDFGFKSNPGMSEIVEKWESAGIRKTDKAPGYIDPETGAIFWKEKNHWDVEVKPTGEFEGELPKKKSLAERVDITNVSREALKEVDFARKQYLRRIRKYKGGYLAEELKELPAHYITKEGGITPDEAVAELGLSEEKELVDYLKGLDAQRTKLIQDIEQNRPELETHYETTLEKEKEKVRLQEQNKAFREMKKMAEEDAKTALKMQKQALKEGKKIGAEIRKQKYFGSEVTPQQRKELYVVALKKGVIYTDYTGKQHDKLQGIIRYYRGSSFDQLKEYLSSLSGDPDNPAKLFKLYGNIDRDAEALKIINKAKEDWQDINKVELYTLDPYRTIEKVSKIPVWADNVLADNTTGVIAAADDAMIDRKALEHAELDANREGILSGSKESAELMRKFEKKEPLTPKEQRVTDFLRAKYDAFIKEANEMRALVGKKPIPYRKDYMTHIVEQNILNEFFKGDERGMKGIAQGQLDAIRKGDYTKGNMPFNKFAQKRMTDKTKYDAIGNFLQYVGVITKEIYYTPAISHVRKFIEYALDKVPNAYKSADRMLSDLQGKTSIADQNVIGAFAGSAPIKWMRTHIARSALVGNINFWATNLSNFAISYDELGNYENIGMMKFLGSKEWRKFAFENSLMLKGRSIDPDFIDQPIHTKLEEFVGSITNLIEYNNVGSTFVGAYLKGVEQLKYSKEQAIEYADAIARRTQVGYKKYELNAWMRSNSGMLMSQFQSWTFNAMNHILYDLGVANLPKDIVSMFTDNKTNRVRWGALLTLIATAITTNYLYEKLGLRKPLDIGSAVPSVSGINKARYQDIGPVAVGKNVAQVFTAKKKSTKIGAAVKAATAFVPGGTQIKRFIEGKIFPPGQKPKTKKKSL